VPRNPVVDDHRQIQPGGHVKLGNKKLDLGIFVPEFAVIVQTDLSYGKHPGQFDALLHNLGPILPGVLHLRRAYPYRVVYIVSGFEVVIYSGKIMKAVANGYNPGNLRLASFLNDNELLNRVFNNKSHMGMSIKILHGFSIKEKNFFIPNWIFLS
jgi:hypothetical protein